MTAVMLRLPEAAMHRCRLSTFSTALNGMPDAHAASALATSGRRHTERRQSFPDAIRAAYKNITIFAFRDAAVAGVDATAHHCDEARNGLPHARSLRRLATPCRRPPISASHFYHEAMLALRLMLGRSHYCSAMKFIKAFSISDSLDKIDHSIFAHSIYRRRTMYASSLEIRLRGFSSSLLPLSELL